MKAPPPWLALLNKQLIKMPLYKFKNKISGEIVDLILSIDEYHNFKEKSIDYIRVLTTPKLKWNATGGAAMNGINDGAVLKKRLADGMSEQEIDQLAETEAGGAVIDQYLNDQHQRGKIVANETNNLFTRELPTGDVCTDYIVEVAEKTGKITKV